jgi:hypothetical protein
MPPMATVPKGSNPAGVTIMTLVLEWSWTAPPIIGVSDRFRM